MILDSHVIFPEGKWEKVEHVATAPRVRAEVAKWTGLRLRSFPAALVSYSPGGEAVIDLEAIAHLKMTHDISR